jgi:hypothetical protein
MKNWKEAATNTALMFKCLFSCNIFHLMKKASSGNTQFCYLTYNRKTFNCLWELNSYLQQKFLQWRKLQFRRTEEASHLEQTTELSWNLGRQKRFNNI